MMIMGSKVRTIALHTFGPLSAVYASYVALFPIVLTLRNSWIHVSSADSSDIASYVEASVDDFFYHWTCFEYPIYLSRLLPYPTWARTMSLKM